MPTDISHKEAARALGQQLGEAGITLIYGGGNVGLMGITANATLAAGGNVTGIIPGHLHDIEVSHENLTELFVVDSMHTRKQKMFELADAFVILPGGLGTLDETFEMMTWKQLKLHDKPIILVDHKGYWQPLLNLIDHMIAQGFVENGATGYFTVVKELGDVMPAIIHEPQTKIVSDTSKF